MAAVLIKKRQFDVFNSLCAFMCQSLSAHAYTHTSSCNHYNVSTVENREESSLIGRKVAKTALRTYPHRTARARETFHNCFINIMTSATASTKAAPRLPVFRFFVRFATERSRAIIYYYLALARFILLREIQKSPVPTTVTTAVTICSSLPIPKLRCGNGATTAVVRIR